MFQAPGFRPPKVDDDSWEKLPKRAVAQADLWRRDTGRNQSATRGCARQIGRSRVSSTEPASTGSGGVIHTDPVREQHRRSRLKGRMLQVLATERPRCRQHVHDVPAVLAVRRFPQAGRAIRAPASGAPVRLTCEPNAQPQCLQFSGMLAGALRHFAESRSAESDPWVLPMPPAPPLLR